MVTRIAFVGYNTAGCWTALQLGFKQLGIDSDVIGDSDHPFQYGNSIVRLPRRVAGYGRVADTASSLAATFGSLPRPVRMPFNRSLELLRSTAKSRSRTALMRWLGQRYDIIFVERNSGIGSRSGDIGFLASLDSKVVFVAFGSDMRPSFLDGAAFPADRHVDWDKMRRQNDRKVVRARDLEGDGATIIATPGTSHFFRQPFVDREIIGFPILPVISDSPSLPADGDRIVILHAPSNPAAKGTEVIRDTVDEVRNLGHEIDFRLLTGVPRKVVANELSAADVVLDQIYSDQYAGVLAREATSAGSNVLIGAHDATWLAATYRTRIPAGLRLVEPSQVFNELVRLCNDLDSLRSSRTEIAESFARLDSLAVVAKKWLQVALGDVESDWFFNPSELDVPLGGFAAREHLVGLASGWVRRYGLEDFESLGKESLATAIRNFAES